jgi:hypothetical protein
MPVIGDVWPFEGGFDPKKRQILGGSLASSYEPKNYINKAS